MTQRAQDTNSRLGNLEAAVSGLVSSVDALVKDSKEHRERVEVDQSRIWAAIEKQGAKGEMSWGKIASVGGFAFVVMSGIGAMAWKLSESRVHQIEVQLVEQEKTINLARNYEGQIRQLESEIRDTHNKFLLRICDETHEGLRRHTENHN